MAADPGIVGRLILFLLPVMGFWLLGGMVIAVLYHLSLYLLDAEFRVSSERALDLFVAVIRGIAFVLAWPAIFIFDRTALVKIKLLVLYLFPEQREKNEELRLALKERDYRVWVRRWALEQQDLKEKRDEARVAKERDERLRVVHEGSPVLDRIWMLTGRGTTPAGSSELVDLYPDYHGVDEVAARARFELTIRRPWTCLRCRTVLEPDSIRLPDLAWLRVVEPGTARTVVEGWALEGEFRQEFSVCPNCGMDQPVMVGPVSSLGHASDVVRAVRSGLNIHSDLA